MNIQFGKPDETWAQYQLIQAPILYNGEKTGYKAVIKEGELVAILGSGYKLLPNEEAIRIANEVAQAIGAKPFKPRGVDVFGDTVMYNKHATRVYVNYIMDEKYEIAGRDTVQLGFSIQNGIDGGLAFSATGFTFREVCSNGVFLGYKRLARFYRKHTAGFEVDKDKIMKIVQNVLDQTRVAIKNYSKLVEMELNEEIAKKIAESGLPKKVLPDYIEIEKGELKKFDPSKSLWDVYNDITAAIWHNVKTDIDRKKARFDILHKVIPVVRM